MWDFFFGWYQGGVWSNILASVLWGIGVQLPIFLGGFIKLHRQRERHHKEQLDSLASLHSKIDSLSAEPGTVLSSK